MKEKIKFILDELKNNNYIILSNTISEGLVYKIHYKGDLNTTGYERGFLVLTKGSSIKEHIHTKEVEKYKLLLGKLSINGKEQKENICLLNESHMIDKVDEVTIIETFKMAKELLHNNKIKVKKV